MAELTEVMSSKCFGGLQKVFEHDSEELKCKMKFSVFMPSTASNPGTKLPVVYFLSGLTSSWENMITKTGIQRYAEQYKLVIVGPDTSPRGCNIPGEDDSWEIGTGASFYVDATLPPWNEHYRMFSYVTKEIREVVERNFSFVDGNRSGITGHSMGGHGALICFLKNPQLYKAVSVFAPLCNPSAINFDSPVIKCFTAYIGENRAAWREYDATELVRCQPQKSVTILMDQGDQDHWYADLMPDNFVTACKEAGQPIEYNYRLGYDHGSFFVSTFVGNHMEHFSKILNQ